VLVLVRSLAVAFFLALLSAPPIVQRVIGGDTRAYVVTTIIMIVAAAAFVLLPDAQHVAVMRSRASSRAMTLAVAVLCATALIVICRRWLLQILTTPIDAFVADMLVVIREGLRRASHGHNPYTIYHVPWAAPLPYGPLLWAPYAVPMLLRADLRFLTIVGQLFVPVTCAFAAVTAAARRRFAPALGLLVLMASIGFSPDLQRFTVAAHTPAYWPLLALFAWLVVERRWRAAAVTLGLLVVARSTTVALVPIFLMAVWQDDRRVFAGACVRVALAAGLPLLPFAVWDWGALEYALYGSYESVVKTVVWPDPTVPHTIGLTGILLSHNLHRWVEFVQVAVMLAIYLASWFALRRGRSPLALMSAALVAFSMTTLWPVYYIYFDPFLLMAAGIVAETLHGPVVRQWSVALVSAIALLVVTAIATLWTMPADQPAFVNRDAPPMASVRLLRRTLAGGAIMAIQFDAGHRRPQNGERVETALNDVPFDTSIVRAENGIVVAVPSSLWQFGLNKLDLRFVSPMPVVRVDVHR
jgi:hypothetical protein